MSKHGPLSTVETVSDSIIINAVENGHTWEEISHIIGYSRVMNNDLKSKFLHRCNQLNILPTFTKRKARIDTQNKGEYFSKSKSWWNAAIGVRKRARKAFMASGKPRCCAVCGYSLHIEVAHIKPVSEFPDDTPIQLINEPSNLIALCPTHHWEFDNGYLKI